MNREAIDHILDYCEDQNLPVQITHSQQGIYIADFMSNVHAKVLHEELKDSLDLVIGYEGPTPTGHHTARLL